MTEEPERFDPGPAFRDDVRRARARVAAMTPEAAKAVLLELVATMPGLVLAPEEGRSALIAYRRGPNDLIRDDGRQLWIQPLGFRDARTFPSLTAANRIAKDLARAWIDRQPP